MLTIIRTQKDSYVIAENVAKIFTNITGTSICAEFIGNGDTIKNTVVLGTYANKENTQEILCELIRNIQTGRSYEMPIDI